VDHCSPNDFPNKFIKLSNVLGKDDKTNPIPAETNPPDKVFSDFAFRISNINSVINTNNTITVIIIVI
jgi:hypothetical protein